LLLLRKADNTIFLEHNDPNKISILDKTLHILYLKSNLKGSFDDSIFSWEFIDDEQLLFLIEKTRHHFNKYNVDIELDPYCEELLKKKKKKIEKFNLVVDNGRKAKNSTSKSDNRKIKDLLYPSFKRKLKDHQVDAVRHLMTVVNGANFSVPGSGKTTVALAYYQILKNQNLIDGIFIIGPGTGKSIIAVNVLAEAAERGKKVFYGCKSKPFIEGLKKNVGGNGKMLFSNLYRFLPFT